MSLVDRNQSLGLDATLDPDVIGGGVGDYFALLKPRVMSLVIFTALVGMVCAPIGVHPVIAFVSLLCIAVGAGASGALNMWYDADIDRIMGRTARRPIPSGAVGAEDALVFGLTLSAFSVLVLGLVANWLAAALLAFTIFFYAVVYTMWLKRSTPQNIVIGGAAGAFPPMIGWAAVTGDIGLPSIVLFTIIFLWTPPHFWALSLVKMEDYSRAGVPMMPCVVGPDATRRQIVVYTVLLGVAAPLPWVVGIAGPVYAAVSVAASLVFLVLSIDLWRSAGSQSTGRAPIRLFLFSIFYLFGLFAVLLVERLLGMVIHG